MKKFFIFDFDGTLVNTLDDSVIAYNESLKIHGKYGESVNKDCVDFDNGVLTINKQMQLHQDKDMKAYQLVSTKNSKARTIITAAPFVMERLKHRKVEQTKERLLAGHWGNRTDLYLQTQPETTSQSRPYIEHLRELLHPLADWMRVFMTWDMATLWRRFAPGTILRPYRGI